MPETQTQLERDNSPPDKLIGTMAPKKPKPNKKEKVTSLFWFIIICGLTSFIAWYYKWI